MSLPDRIRDYIAKRNEPVTLAEIFSRASLVGFSKTEVMDAIRQVHHFKDIAVKVKDNTNVYTIRQVKEYKPQPRFTTSPEDRDRMDSEVKDFWEHSPLVSDEERECYHASMKDKNHYKTCPSTSCTHWRWMLMNRDERALVEIERVRGVLKMI